MKNFFLIILSVICINQSAVYSQSPSPSPSPSPAMASEIQQAKEILAVLADGVAPLGIPVTGSVGEIITTLRFSVGVLEDAFEDEILEQAFSELFQNGSYASFRSFVFFK